MNEFTQKKALRAKIALAVDALVQDAREFIKSHKDLHRELTNAQLYGLLNVVRNVRDLEDLMKKHAQHQATKAANAGRRIETFWRSWEKKLVELQEKAKEIARSVNPAWMNDSERINRISQILRIKYVQHLIAEKLTQKSQS